MTAPDVVELGRRAVACAGWRWCEGMRAVRWADEYEPARVVHGDECGVSPAPLSSDGHSHGLRPAIGTCDDWWAGYVPDITDPATLGALLGLVREAWADKIEISIGCGWWEVWTDQIDDGRWDYEGTPSLAAALVAALEAAPMRS